MIMPEPTVLVFGASGGIGRAVIEELLPDHRTGRLNLVASARRAEAVEALRDLGIGVRQLDLDDAEVQGLGPVADAVQGIDRILIITGYDVRMLAQSKAVVDAARAANVAHLVHVGVSAEQDSTIVHFAWHQLIEAYIERSGLGFTHLWPASFMQNLSLSAGHDHPDELVHWIGDAEPNWVDVRDIATVAAMVLRDPAPYAGAGYHLAAEAASLPDIAVQLSETSGRPWRYRSAEPTEFYDQMVAAGADPVYIACVRNVFERTRNGTLRDPAHALADLPRLLGRPPRTIRDYLEDWRSSQIAT